MRDEWRTTTWQTDKQASQQVNPDHFERMKSTAGCMRISPYPLLVLTGALLRRSALALPFTSVGRSSRTTLCSGYHDSQHSSYPISMHSSDDEAQAGVSDEGEGHFMARCKELCEVRNLPFSNVKNARDLASVRNSRIKPGRVFRMGRLSDASESDIKLLKQLNIRTLVDLRSPTELRDDPALLREDVFNEFTDLVWKEQGRGKDGCLSVIPKGGSPLNKRKFWTWQNRRSRNEYDDSGFPDAEGANELCTLDCDDPESVPVSLYETDRRERHFVSVINEFKYVKGTVSRLRKRDISKAILKSPGAIVSKRVRNSVKKPFLDEINVGGLPMLNELLLRFGAPGIKYVLELVADRKRHPIAWYCAAGKDRTGVIAALVLSLCGVSDEDIVEDYSLSANVYAEMNDHQAMVGALSQRNLDPKTFLGAPPQVMRDTLQAISSTYGSVSDYCCWIGFGPDKQEALRRACMDD
jgi:protein tyrosine/serine phosphatase